MSKLLTLGVAFILLLAAFPLISRGTTGDTTALWWLGLGCLAIGGLIPPLTRFVFAEEDKKQASDEERETQ